MGVWEDFIVPVNEDVADRHDSLVELQVNKRHSNIHNKDDVLHQECIVLRA